MSDGELFYLKKGDGGEVVLLLHGLFGSAKNLNAIAVALSKRFIVYSVDLPNHGQSSRVEDMSIESMARSVINFAREYGISRFSMFGHSLGGKVAMAVALIRGDMVSRIAVGDIAPVTYVDRHATILRGLEFASEGGIDSRQQADQRLAKYINDVGIRQFLLHSLRRDGDQYQWRFNLSQIARDYLQLCEFLGDGDESPQYQNPVLFLRGEHSNYIDDRHQAAIDQYFPRNTVKTIDGAGHWLHADKPKDVCRELETFFSV